MKINKIILIIVCFLLLAISVFGQNTVPVIETVNVEQRINTKKVDIYYDVLDFDNDNLLVLVKVSDDGGVTFKIPAQTFSGDYGLGIIPGSDKHIMWNAGIDYPEHVGENYRVKLIVSDAKINVLSQVEEGSFLMGEGAGIDDPVHEIVLDVYGICPHAVSNEEYKLFCDATNRNYPQEGSNYQAPTGYFLNYKDYPVVGISWYDAVSYCNWLSELDNLEPCYNLSNWIFDPTKSGYHLPTEAQWEKAARGALSQKTFPWGDTAPGNRCNYSGYAGALLETMPDFDGQGRGTIQVESLNTNYYGMYNIAGNVWEWCNDWYQRNYYDVSPSENPLGPESGEEKVIRGGAWNTSDIKLHCAFRDRYSPGIKQYDIGFRIAK